MFVIIPTYVQISNVKLILKLLQHKYTATFTNDFNITTNYYIVFDQFNNS
jgi:ribosomal protein S17E